MARLIIKYPDVRLRGHSVEVNPEDWTTGNVKLWCQDIHDTMVANAGLGLAAPQVGIKKRIFAVDGKQLDNAHLLQQETKDGKLFFINPVIKHTIENDAKSIEACLSVPGAMYAVKRSSEVEITYTTIEGKQVSAKVKGEDAVVLQHEYEHLDGKLFIDRLNVFDRKEFMKRFEKQKHKKSDAEISHLREMKRLKARKNRKK